jgi:ribosome maturation factor RimP
MPVGLKDLRTLMVLLAILLWSSASFGAEPCGSLGSYFDLVLHGKDPATSLQAARIDKAGEAFITENGRTVKIATDGFEGAGVLRYTEEGSDELFTIDVADQRFLSISLTAPETPPAAMLAGPDAIVPPRADVAAEQLELDLRGGEGVRSAAPARVEAPSIDPAPSAVARVEPPAQLRLDLGDQPVQPSLFPDEALPVVRRGDVSEPRPSVASPEPLIPPAVVNRDSLPAVIPSRSAPVQVADSVAPPQVPVVRADTSPVVRPSPEEPVVRRMSPEEVAQTRPPQGDINLVRGADGSYSEIINPVPAQRAATDVVAADVADAVPATTRGVVGDATEVVDAGETALTLTARPSTVARITSAVEEGITSIRGRLSSLLNSAEEAGTAAVDSARRAAEEAARRAVTRSDFPRNSTGKTFTWTTRGGDPRRVVRRQGEVVRFNDQSVVVRIDGTEQTIRFRDIKASSLAEVNGPVRLASKSDFSNFVPGESITFTSRLRRNRRVGTIVRVEDRRVIMNIDGVETPIAFNRIRSNSISTTADHYAGVFRRITDSTDFPASSIGKVISWTTPAGRVRKTGKVVRFNDQSVVVEIDGVQSTIRFRDMQSESISIVQRNIRLAARSDFPDSLMGRDVSFTTPAGRSSTTGRVLKINEGSVVLEINGQRRNIRFRDIGGNSVDSSQSATTSVARVEADFPPPSTSRALVLGSDNTLAVTSDSAREAARRQVAVVPRVQPSRALTVTSDSARDAARRQVAVVPRVQPSRALTVTSDSVRDAARRQVAVVPRVQPSRALTVTSDSARDAARRQVAVIPSESRAIAAQGDGLVDAGDLLAPAAREVGGLRPSQLDELANDPVQLEFDFPTTAARRAFNNGDVVDGTGAVVRNADELLQSGNVRFSRRLLDGTLEFIGRGGRILRILPRAFNRIRRIVPTARALNAISREVEGDAPVPADDEPVGEGEPIETTPEETGGDPAVTPEETAVVEDEPVEGVADPFAEDRVEEVDQTEPEGRTPIPRAPRGNPVRPTGIPGIKNTIMIKRGVL